MLMRKFSVIKLRTFLIMDGKTACFHGSQRGNSMWRDCRSRDAFVENFITLDIENSYNLIYSIPISIFSKTITITIQFIRIFDTLWGILSPIFNIWTSPSKCWGAERVKIRKRSATSPSRNRSLMGALHINCPLNHYSIIRRRSRKCRYIKLYLRHSDENSFFPAVFREKLRPRACFALSFLCFTSRFSLYPIRFWWIRNVRFARWSESTFRSTARIQFSRENRVYWREIFFGRRMDVPALTRCGNFERINNRMPQLWFLREALPDV